MTKSKSLTEKLKRVLSQGQGGAVGGGGGGASGGGGAGSVGGAAVSGAVGGGSSSIGSGGTVSVGTPTSVGDGVRGGSSSLGPSYAAAPGKGLSSPTGDTTTQTDNKPLSISGAGWMNYFASPLHPRRRKQERETLN